MQLTGMLKGINFVCIDINIIASMYNLLYV